MVCLALEDEGIMTLQYVGSHSPVDTALPRTRVPSSLGVVCLTLEDEGIKTLQYVGSHSPVDTTLPRTRVPSSLGVKEWSV